MNAVTAHLIHPGHSTVPATPTPEENPVSHTPTTTDRATWPQQIRLPGQAAAPEGPIDLTTMFVMHHAFRRDLAAFATAAATTPVEDRRTWVALAERWALFAAILHHHHHGEDAGLWPLLAERSDAAGREVLAAMEAEHAEIDPLLEASAAGFERLARTADEDVRAALAVRLAAARESLGRHLEHEETEALAIAQAVMTEEEWVHMEMEHFRRSMSPRMLLKVVPWAAYGAPREQREEVLSRSGLANRVIAALTRRGFEARERVAFRYLG